MMGFITKFRPDFEARLAQSRGLPLLAITGASMIALAQTDLASLLMQAAQVQAVPASSLSPTGWTPAGRFGFCRRWW